VPPPPPPPQYIIGTQRVTDLAPGANITLTFTWDTTNVTPCHNYTITAYAVPVLGEPNIADNTLSSPTRVKIKMMGDINGDGKIDMQDIYILIQAFGSNPTHPRWNPITDINEDNRVDMKDIYLVITNFGKTI